jgi:hypothetical protein
MTALHAKPSILPGPEQDEQVSVDCGREFRAAVGKALADKFRGRKRPCGWSALVDRTARSVASLIHRFGELPPLPGVYKFSAGDTVGVWVSWGGLPAFIRGEILWGPGRLFGRSWVKIAGLGVVPASRVKFTGGGRPVKTPPPPDLVEEGCLRKRQLPQAAG